MAGEHVTSATDYGSCVATSEWRPSRSGSGNEETQLLVKNERSVVSRRAVVTVVILTAINLLNYADRYIIAGQHTTVGPYIL